MSKVPFVEFSKVPDHVLKQQKHAVNEVIDSGYFVGGPYVAQFEEEWAKSIGSRYAIGVGNGFDGLVMALRALEIGNGDLVAVPAHTFIATWNSIVHVGATPVGIDVDGYGLLDLDALEKVSRRISAVIPVHMHGMMVDMNRLNNWARSHSIKVIEDASQSHHAEMNGNFAGNMGDIGVFSLYPSKNLGALGDAGIVTTNSAGLNEKIRAYGNYGASNQNKYTHSSFGINSRLDSIQAAALSVNLKYLKDWNQRRREIANLYITNLVDSKDFELINPGVKPSVWHHFLIRTPVRAAIREYLLKNGVQTEIHYPNLAANEYAEITKSAKEPFLYGEDLSRKILSLPISPWHTNDQILFVCTLLNEFKE
jgi:dTDP-4-amino-4,6-dideoxygalactose transaminase